VLLDTAGDAAAAAGVAVTGAVIAVRGGWYWLDPVVALMIAAVIAFHTVKLLGNVHDSMRAGAVQNPQRGKCRYIAVASDDSGWCWAKQQ
jgi:cobalt-zinc-cadmium efflux system protein